MRFSNISSANRLHLGLAILLATLKTLSDGADVACTYKTFLANLSKTGQQDSNKHFDFQ